jgi:hypothetical protein
MQSDKEPNTVAIVTLVTQKNMKEVCSHYIMDLVEVLVNIM